MGKPDHWQGLQRRWAYREIRGDGHQIIVFSGADIVSILRAVGITTIAALRVWRTQEFRFDNSVQPLPYAPVERPPSL